jgi:DNA-binding GntR family transcriptional regulator
MYVAKSAPTPGSACGAPPKFDQIVSIKLPAGPIKLPAGLRSEERTLSGRAFTTLRDAIVSGEIAPGTRLDLTALATELDMSPMPIREAIRQLDALGLIEHNPHRSARVTGLSIEDLREVYAARFAIEAWAVAEAARRFEDSDAELAAGSLKRTVEAQRETDHAASWDADTEFHFALYQAAGSGWLLRLITPLWGTSERYRRLSQSPERDFDERYREHRSILDACIAHDADLAARLLGRHLARSANRLSMALEGSQLFDEDAVELLPLPRSH